MFEQTTLLHSKIIGFIQTTTKQLCHIQDFTALSFYLALPCLSQHLVHSFSQKICSLNGKVNLNYQDDSILVLSDSFIEFSILFKYLSKFQNNSATHHIRSSKLLQNNENAQEDFYAVKLLNDKFDVKCITATMLFKMIKRLCINRIEWHISHGLAESYREFNNVFVITPLKKKSERPSIACKLNSLHNVKLTNPKGSSMFQTESEWLYTKKNYKSFENHYKNSSHQLPKCIEPYCPNNNYCDVCLKNFREFNAHLKDKTHNEEISKEKHIYIEIEKLLVNQPIIKQQSKKASKKDTIHTRKRKQCDKVEIDIVPVEQPGYVLPKRLIKLLA